MKTLKLFLTFICLIICNNLYAQTNSPRGKVSGELPTVNCEDAFSDSACLSTRFVPGNLPSNLEIKNEYVTVACPPPNQTATSLIQRTTIINKTNGEILSVTDSIKEPCPGNFPLEISLNDNDKRANYNVKIISNTPNALSIECGGGRAGPISTSCTYNYTDKKPAIVARVEFATGQILPEQGYGYTYAINGATCKGRFENNAATGAVWKGGIIGNCTGDGVNCNGFICDITMNKPRKVNIDFTKNNQPNYAKLEAIAEKCLITGANLNCPNNCSANQMLNSNVNITATAYQGYTFYGWEGDAAGCGDNKSCSLTMDSDKIVGAVCVEDSSGTDNTVSVVIEGSGVVTGTGINCPGDCTEVLANNATIVLAAYPANGFIFSSWGGDAASCGNSGGCSIVMGANKNISAKFISNPNKTYNLNINKIGNGYVVGPGISCNPDCSEGYQENTVVNLTAQADNQSKFSSWKGDGANCGNNTNCTINMNSDKNIIAEFVSADCPAGFSGNPPNCKRVFPGGQYTSCENPPEVSLTQAWDGNSFKATIRFNTANSRNTIYNQYRWNQGNKSWIVTNFAASSAVAGIYNCSIKETISDADIVYSFVN